MMTLPKDWHEVLKEELQKPYIQDLKNFLSAERSQGLRIFPIEEDVFNAMRFTPFSDVKVVIVGQDPYHGLHEAHGLSFSVREGVPIPPSLRNIFKEISTDIGLPPPSSGSLERWARQGVLLLNSTLTVRENAAKSHYGRGWEEFTDALLRRVWERPEKTVFLLWGRSAKEKLESVMRENPYGHALFLAPHPSPLSAHTGFFGCKHFSKTNKNLKKWNKTEIIW